MQCSNALELANNHLLLLVVVVRGSPGSCQVTEEGLRVPAPVVRPGAASGRAPPPGVVLLRRGSLARRMKAHD